MRPTAWILWLACTLPTTALPWGEHYQTLHAGGRIYHAQGSAGLHIDTPSGQHLGEFPSGDAGHRSLDREWVFQGGGICSAVAVKGNSAFLLLQRRGYDTQRTRVVRLDVSEPAQPRVINSYLLKGTASHLSALDEETAGVDQNFVHLPLKGNAQLRNGPASGQAQLQAQPPVPTTIGALPRLAHGLLCGQGCEDENGQRLSQHPCNQALRIGARLLHLNPQGLWEHERRLGAGGLAMDILDNAIVVADGNGLAVIDLQKGTSERLELPGARALHIVGKRAAVALGRRGAALIDLSQPQQPKIIARYFDRERGRMAVVHVHLQGEELLAADADNGLYQLDTSNQQLRVSQFVAMPNALSVARQGNHIAVANGVYGLIQGELSAMRQSAIGDCTDVAYRQGKLEAVIQGQRRSVPPLPSQPLSTLTYTGTVPVPMGIPRRMAVSPDQQSVWIANDEGWNLLQIDLREPTQPRLQRILATGGFARSVACRDEWVAATTHNSCQLFSARDGTCQWSLAAPETGHLAFAGDGLWFESRDKVVGLDLQDPRRPRQATALPGKLQASWEERDLRLIGLAEAGQWNVFDVRRTSQPSVVAELPVANVSAAVGLGEHLWLSNSSGIQHFLSGKRSDTRAANGARALAAFPDGTLAWAGPLLGWTRGSLQIPAPAGAGTYAGNRPTFVDLKTLKTKNDYLLALDAYYGLRIYDDQLNPVASYPCNGGDYTGMSIDQGKLYVATNWGGVHLIEDGQARRLQDISPNPGATGLLAHNGQLYYQGNVDRTLHILSQGQHHIAQRWQGSGDERRFGGTFPVLQGNLLYTPGYARILDISDPARVKVVGECPQAGFQHDSCLLWSHEQRNLLILSGADGLTVVDVSQPTQPRKIAFLAGDYLGGYYFARGMTRWRDDLLICNRAQLNIVDLSQPETPRLRAQIELSGTPCDVVVQHNRAYLACYFGGIEIVDLQQLRRIGHFQRGAYQDWGGAGWDNLSCHPCLALDGDRLYVADYYSGVQSWRIR